MVDIFNQRNTLSIFNSKSGAMFGLDARIALGIFAGLSVITGAMMHKSIRESKAVALLTEMQEVGKAFEHYFLTTGFYPEKADALPSINFYNYKTALLKENLNNMLEWQGPYVSYKIGTAPDYISHPKYNNIQILLLTDENNWGGAVGGWDAGLCDTASKQCYATVMFNGIPDESLAEIIDKKVDNSDGPSSGNFRWWTDGSNITKYRYHLIYMPVENPHV